MRQGTVLGLSARGFHRVAYAEWGEGTAPRTVVCVHGLTRNGRDFDALAGDLAARGRRVVCPDVVGRGDSDRLADPLGYGFPQYLADMTALIARLDVDAVDWVGTSMGGLIGLLLAVQPNSPVRRLVLNDVGPFVPKAALERIAANVAGPTRFPDLSAAEAHLRVAQAGFGALTDAEWRDLTRRSVRPAADGGWLLAFDPAIAVPMTAQPIADVDLWPLWDAVRCPVLVLRGARSDLLTAGTAAAMAARGPKARVVEIADAGHAPALLDPAQIAVVRTFLGEE
ncbi:MAG: alpha/beta fold hydrolase [Rhodospirillales bacterium]|jgi:pimeloyl-ACP methyl ester carboxylesterase